MKEKIKKIPLKPGVYLFKNKQGKIIYVGKAMSLRTRVNQYFTKRERSPKRKQLVNKIADVDYILTSSEKKALLLETKLIKQHQPKYNSRLKDSKSPLYIAITKEKAPRIYLIRRPQEKKNLQYWFGPFPSSQAAKESLRFIRKIFPFRSCKNMPDSPCLYHHINLCPAPCTKNIPQYKKTINKIIRFLEGENKQLTKEMEQQMHQAAQKLNFEKAEKIKQQLQSLKYFFTGWKRPDTKKASSTNPFDRLHRLLVKHQQIDPLIVHRLEAYDIANIQSKYTAGAMSVLLEGKPEPKEYRRFKISNIQLPDDPNAIKQVLFRRFKHKEWNFPQAVLIDGGKQQVRAALRALNQRNIKGIGLLGITKEEEILVIPQLQQYEIVGWKTIKLEKESPLLQSLQFARDEAHRFAQKYHHLLQEKDLFDN